MKRVTGLGGIFFKSAAPEATSEWYRKHLGIELESATYGSFKWRELEHPEKTGMTVWSTFDQNSECFGPGPQSFMVNYRVENLDAVLAALQAEGVTVCPEREDQDYGRFAWIIDPEGRRIELWQPPVE